MTQLKQHNSWHTTFDPVSNGGTKWFTPDFHEKILQNTPEQRKERLGKSSTPTVQTLHLQNVAVKQNWFPKLNKNLAHVPSAIHDLYDLLAESTFCHLECKTDVLKHWPAV